MIYFLYGPDQYRLYQKVKEIVNHYQKIHGGSMNLVRLEAPEASLINLIDIARQPSMFVEHRLIILKDPFSFSLPLQRRFKKEIPFFQSSPVIFLFYQQGKERKNDLSRTLKKYAKTQFFPFLDYSGTRQWLIEESKLYHLTFQDDALNKLALSVQGDLWRGHLYLNKIASWQKGSKRVDLALVRKIIDPQESLEDRFALTKALQAGQQAKALQEVNDFLDRGEAPEIIVGQLNSWLSRLLFVRILLDQGETQWNIQSKVPFNPKATYFIIKAARSFSVEFLKRKIQDLFQIDLGVKTGRLSPREAINDFILRFPENALTKSSDEIFSD